MAGAGTIDTLHLVGLGGSNKVMAGELSRLMRRAFSQERSKELLAVAPEKSGPGGLIYPFASDLAALAVTYHRTSARVLWGLYESSQSRLEPLFDELVEAIAADERLWMQDDAGISVLAFQTKSVDAGERQVVGVVKNALIEGAARRGVKLRLDVQRPDLTFHVRGQTDRHGQAKIVVSLDLAGRPMHERGYRTWSGDAPLREDLAANLVMLSRFDARSEILIDPLAGSGTLVVEAALMASARPVWMSGRSPACRALPFFQDEFSRWGKPLFADSAPRFYAAELEERTYGALDRALMTAGTSPQTTTFLGDFRDWRLRDLVPENQTGVILSNPPYGARLSSDQRELRKLYSDLADWCRGFRGFRAGFIVGEPEDRAERNGPSVVRLFEDAFGGRPRVKKPVSNGPLRAQFLLYDL